MPEGYALIVLGKDLEGTSFYGIDDYTGYADLVHVQGPARDPAKPDVIPCIDLDLPSS